MNLKLMSEELEQMSAVEKAELAKMFDKAGSLPICVSCQQDGGTEVRCFVDSMEQADALVEIAGDDLNQVHVNPEWLKGKLAEQAG
jgi:hypothetical protein